MAKTIILLAVSPDESGLVLRVELSKLQPETIETEGEAAPPSPRPMLAKCPAPVRALRVVGGGK